VTEGNGHVIDTAGDARQALQAVVAEHGPEALSNAVIMDRICQDRLSDLPGEAILIGSAARTDVPALLRDQIPRMGNYGAIQSVATTLAEAHGLDSTACLWVVREFARALGLIASGGTHPTARISPAEGTGQGAAPSPTPAEPPAAAAAAAGTAAAAAGTAAAGVAAPAAGESAEGAEGASAGGSTAAGEGVAAAGEGATAGAGPAAGEGAGPGPVPGEAAEGTSAESTSAASTAAASTGSESTAAATTGSESGALATGSPGGEVAASAGAGGGGAGVAAGPGFPGGPGGAGFPGGPGGPGFPGGPGGAEVPPGVPGMAGGPPPRRPPSGGRVLNRNTVGVAAAIALVAGYLGVAAVAHLSPFPAKPVTAPSSPAASQGNGASSSPDGSPDATPDPTPSSDYQILLSKIPAAVQGTNNCHNIGTAVGANAVSQCSGIHGLGASTIFYYQFADQTALGTGYNNFLTNVVKFKKETECTNSSNSFVDFTAQCESAFTSTTPSLTGSIAEYTNKSNNPIIVTSDDQRHVMVVMVGTNDGDLLAYWKQMQWVVP